MPQFSDDLFLGPAETYMGTGLRNASTTAIGGTGSVSSTTLTITSVGFGAPIVVGMYVDGAGVTDGTFITALGTGTGGAGTYTLNQAINIANTVALTLHDLEPFDNPSPMSLGIGLDPERSGRNPEISHLKIVAFCLLLEKFDKYS